MTKAVFARRGMALLPVDDEAREVLTSIKDGRDVMVEVKPSRRPKQHRAFFALMNLLVENADLFPNVEAALTATKIAIGEVDPIIDARTGKTFWTVRSIAFESCDQARFNRIFDRALHIITTRWLVGTDAEELRREVYRIVDPADAIGERAA